MTPSEDYLEKCRGLLGAVEAQLAPVRRAADLFAQTILAGRMVHVFGSGHSRIMVEEMWPRYGSFPGFNPIVELSLTFHNLVVGGEVLVQDGTDQHVRAVRLLEDGPERDAWWARAVEAFPPYADYQVRTERLIPVFVLEPVSPV